PAIRDGRHVLIAAPTGSGKTLAAFLAAIHGLVRQGLEGGLPDETQVVYVSPLKALSNDIKKNLDAPLAGIAEELRARGLPEVEIRSWVRTGDTPQGERAQMRKRPPHIVVTTPESLYILLGSESGRQMLATVKSVIVDEIHAVAPNKRGSHLALSLERLAMLCNDRLQRIGLSATQKPIEAVARFLVGADPAAECTIIDTGHRRARDLALELPSSSLELGIDIGDVDLACQLGSPRAIATFLQRVGRSGHAVAGTPKGRLFPLSRDELVECAALLDSVRRGELDRLSIPEQPLDALAQQIVAEVAARQYGEDELYALVRRAWPYRNLAREDFAAIVEML